MKQVILVESVGSGKKTIYKSLVSMCKELGLSYNTITKCITPESNYYENKKFRIYRMPIR